MSRGFVGCEQLCIGGILVVIRSYLLQEKGGHIGPPLQLHNYESLYVHFGLSMYYNKQLLSVDDFAVKKGGSGADETRTRDLWRDRPAF